MSKVEDKSVEVESVKPLKSSEKIELWAFNPKIPHKKNISRILLFKDKFLFILLIFNYLNF